MAAISLPSTSAAPQWSTSSRLIVPLPFARIGSSNAQISSGFFPRVICSSSFSDLQPGGRVSADALATVWKKAPKPVREFPWRRAGERLIQHLSEVTWSAAKWLLVPVILLSSLSEISYSLVQNKEFLIPIGMLVGVYLAGVLKDTALELSEDLQKGEVPWHLITIGLFFALVKFPGPSYPYWGRVFLPHFATGGLLSTFFFAWNWKKIVEE